MAFKHLTRSLGKDVALTAEYLEPKLLGFMSFKKKKKKISKFSKLKIPDKFLIPYPESGL